MRRRYPILADACRVIADPLVRNLATVGGNLAHGDPANDHPAVMLALEAEVVAVGPRGARRIPVAEFFTGPLTTALGAGEILTEIRIPLAGPARGRGLSQARAEGGRLRDGGGRRPARAGRRRHVRAGGDRPHERGRHADQGPARRGAPPRAGGWTRRRSADGSRQAAAESDPSEDLRGSVAYKRDLVRVLTARAIRRALERATAAH